MLLAAKIALGICGTMAVATAYTFHEGVIRVDVDEAGGNGSHVHFWVPATVVPMTLHVVPRAELERATARAREWMPVLHAFAKELKNYPEAELVDVRDETGREHVQIRTHEGKLLIDADEPDSKVHLMCPVETLEDITSEIEASGPGA